MKDMELVSWLKARGFIVPRAEPDVDAFEKAIDAHNIPIIPDDLDSPPIVQVKAE